MKRWRVVLALACGAGAHALPAAEPTGFKAAPPETLRRNEKLIRDVHSQWTDYLAREIEQARGRREQFWHRDHSSPEAYAASIEPNRNRLRQRIGAVDTRTPGELELLTELDHPGPLRATGSFSAWHVRWPVLPGVHGEGVLLMPTAPAKAWVVVLPDADSPPEALCGLLPGSGQSSPVAQRLAEQSIAVVVMTLVNRETTFSGDERLGRFTDQTHREWIYRQAAPVGRHIIGYEVQKVSAAIDAILARVRPGMPRPRIGVWGYGEGGLLALYAGALDQRLDVTAVSGYFGPRERVWSEPLYRSVWGLLEEFGDAEIASLVAPRGLVVEQVAGPAVPSRPDKNSGPFYARSAAAGAIVSPRLEDSQREWARALALVGKQAGPGFQFIVGKPDTSESFGTAETLRAVGAALGAPERRPTSGAEGTAVEVRSEYIRERQKRTVAELQQHAQHLADLSEYGREESFWKLAKPVTLAKWPQAMQPLRARFVDEIIGDLGPVSSGPAIETRAIPEFSDDGVATQEIRLEVYPGVTTWGYLMVPRDLGAGERRPVVVCQHGARGDPAGVLEGSAGSHYATLRGFGTQLARQGFIVFAPYNPNMIGGAAWVLLQRRANLLRKSVFSIITADHRRILDWLKEQPFVDASRIAFYGLSYGGKTAMRVPAVLDDYCLSICSGDFNDYVRKMTSVRQDKNGFMFSASFETIEFNLAPTFNYAEMVALIAPRPFMVEHGYRDIVAPLEWAGAEYAKVQRLYFNLGIPERTAIEYFDGVHEIRGRGTFDFLHRHLQWPKP